MTSSAGWSRGRRAAGASPSPAVAVQHRMNAGIIVEQPLMDVRFKNGRKLGTVEEGFASTLAPGDHFFFAGLSLEVERIKDTDIIVHASSKSARIVTYGGQRMSMSTHLANRVRHMLADRNDWHRFPDDVQRMARGPEPSARCCPSRRTAGRDLRRITAGITWSPTASKAGTRTSRSAC